jgi:hypothetical protein
LGELDIPAKQGLRQGETMFGAAEPRRAWIFEVSPGPAVSH